jgi:hypothetical protein
LRHEIKVLKERERLNTSTSAAEFHDDDRVDKEIEKTKIDETK